MFLISKKIPHYVFNELSFISSKFNDLNFKSYFVPDKYCSKFKDNHKSMYAGWTEYEHNSMYTLQL